ncbi:hypothetical protein ACL9RF_13155 [Sphingobacterium sp. Mn56C]|uniref:hypothetical protein n=1 Tax=Sphingobacterium sp. Mn56C TaxID=3395261 RepID=UPI003BE6B7C0
MIHTFHIPVLGLAFSADSPLKVAQYGISSVISVVDDELMERLRKYYSSLYNKGYNPISSKDLDSRANRITAYLNLVYDIVSEQVHKLRTADFDRCLEWRKFFDLLPNQSKIKAVYDTYKQEANKEIKIGLANTLRTLIQPGDINVNIMSKVDKINTDSKGIPLAHNYSDASASLRGFAQSKLQASLVLSAGMNPRLYNYLSELPQFLPNEEGQFSKQIILKVSDYRSALIQAKYLAKKGVWIAEYRIESGLNCGGHAFATDGFLLGPILEEFKQHKTALKEELFTLYRQALQQKGITLKHCPAIKITAQGGIGTHHEHSFLLDYYQLDATGWGSPFLLVPEATTVDDNTLDALANAEAKDFYISGSSPLGVPFNNFSGSTAEQHRRTRIEAGRPGAPCTKKYLILNTEYGGEPICTASRLYQHKKIKEIEALGLDAAEQQKQVDAVTEKTCLCEGLATAAYLKYGIMEPKENPAVAICPGPNTVFFNRRYSLQEMVDHIYGRTDLLNNVERPSLFINELRLYIKHLEKFIAISRHQMDDKKDKYVHRFTTHLLQGIGYYRNLAPTLYAREEAEEKIFLKQLDEAEQQLVSNYLPID